MSSSFWGYSIMVAFLTGATANAQSSNFHLDLIPDGQTTWTVLVNYSPNTIEFVSLRQDCSLLRQIIIRDALDHPEYDPLIRDAAGNPARSIGPEQGGTWKLHFFPNSDKSKYVGECAPQAEFILFGDGSYEGTESQARSLKTNRDGMFACIIEWLEILNRQDADGFDVAALQKLASKRRDDDRQKALKYCKPGQSDCDESARLSYEYWGGKWRVDAEISGCLDVSKMVGRDWCENDRPRGQVFQNTRDFFERWKSKFDEDPAMKRLREVFPPSVPK